MSTVQGYDYSVAEAERSRLAVELERRRLGAARLRAEQSRRELHRLASQLRENRAALSRVQTAELETTTRKLAKDLEAAKQNLVKAEEDLRNHVTSAVALGVQAEQEGLSLQEAITEARDSLGEVEQISRLSLRSVEDLEAAASAGTGLSLESRELEHRIHQLESEIRFITQHEDCRPAAMVTLMSMQQNGYELREVMSRGELVSYFEKADTGHQIAVRFTPVAREGEKVEQWELLAETFHMTGETCLYELDDFETAMQDVGIGDLKRGRFRVYPKDDKAGRSVLAPPPKSVKKRGEASERRKESAIR